MVIADTLGPLEMEYKNALKIIQGGSIKSDGLISTITKVTTYKFDGDEAEKVENQLKYDESTIMFHILLC